MQRNGNVLRINGHTCQDSPLKFQSKSAAADLKFLKTQSGQRNALNVGWYDDMHIPIAIDFYNLG